LETCLEYATPQFLTYYDHLVEILKENQSFDKLLQILFGPNISVNKHDINELTRYGIIKFNGNNYQAFSTHFDDYLRILYREVELWPLWRKTEKQLRIVITQIMKIEYNTEDWIPKLESAKPKLRDILDKCRQAQAREQKSFGGRASVNLLDFTYPHDLYSIISNHWKRFEPIFGQDTSYWSKNFNLLAKIRNPIAHVRDEVIEEHERQIAEGYCKEILTLLSENIPELI
jgi:hypothetical protein